MIPLSLRTMARITQGTLVCSGKTPRTYTSATIDSRNVPPGSVFIAIKGDTHDSHEFIPELLKIPCALVVSRPESVAGVSNPAIIVTDTRKALGQLGAHCRERFAGTVIAIGGSNGKTTTKHMVGSVLAARLKGTQSPKSFNNDIGVPLTLLGVSRRDHYVVLELGTNHPGELAPLSIMAQPNIAVITSIGAEHLEGFADLDGVRREELTLLNGLMPNGVAIVNGDDPILALARRRSPSQLISFGFDPDNDLAITSTQCSLDGVQFTIRGEPEPFYVPLPGRHNASNALAAIAVGRAMSMGFPTIRKALANTTRPEMRMQTVRAGDITILNDAYNANPASMSAALETLRDADVPGRRIAVLGEMRELGEHSAALHQQIGQLAVHCKLDLLIAVGPGGQTIAAAALAAGMPKSKVKQLADSAAAAARVPGLLRKDDTVLLKASRTIKLELVAQAIAKQFNA